MLQAFSLTKSFGGRVLFDDLSFSMGKNEIVGLVGRNGSGKSTLFKMILGEETYDSGTLSLPKGYTLGHLSQHIHFTKDTVLEESCLALSEDEQWDFYKAEKILFGLGFNEETIYQSPKNLSGGYQLRVNLTKCLLQKPNLLLLDEPTNYLDLPSLRWMRKFLKSLQGEVIIITHDRGFMDSVTTHTMGIHRGKLIKVSGSTDKYYEQLAANEELYEKTRQKQEKKIKHMQEFVDRFRAQAAKATQAQSKLKQIEKIDVKDELRAESDIKLQFRYKTTPAKTLMKANDLSFSYDENTPNLFENISLEVNAKDRIAIIGKNGKGKTTLLKVLAQELQTKSGDIYSHPDTAIGYYQQTNTKNLNPKNTVAQEILHSNNDLTISQTRAICGAMMFSGDDADKKISVLSGGEQGRVLLGKILANPANLLLLDEPTNHLDMYSIDIMIEELKDFPGAVVIVTHSEDILRTLANKFVIFNRGKATEYFGTYDEFLEKIGWEDEDSSSDKNNKKISENTIRQENSKKEARENKRLQKDIERIELQIVELEKSLEEKNQQAIELSKSSSKQNEVAELYKEIHAIQKQIDQAFSELENLNRQ